MPKSYGIGFAERGTYGLEYGRAAGGVARREDSGGSPPASARLDFSVAGNSQYFFLLIAW